MPNTTNTPKPTKPRARQYTATNVLKRVEALLKKENYNSDFNGACLSVIKKALTGRD
jgi:hypothetical protein